MVRRPFSAPLAALVLLVAAGCSSGRPATADSAGDAFARAQAALDARKCDRAVELFRTTLDFGRTGEVADDAQLGIARAYACSKQYLLAGAEFTRFVELYRTDPRVEDASYESILAYSKLSPTYELDQTYTATAIQYIDAYVRQYPAGTHTAEVQTLLGELREKLAHKQFEEGRLYERRDLFEAAVLSYQKLLADYPASAYADDALLGALRAQVLYADNSIAGRQAERYGEALRLYAQLTSLFPQSPTLVDAQAFYDRAYEGSRRAAPVAPATAQAPLVLAPTETAAETVQAP